MKWIAQFPSTNGKIVVGLFLAVVYIITALVADVFNRELSEATHIAVAAFLSALIGIATYQYKVKRETHIDHEAPTANVDVEDAKAIRDPEPADGIVVSRPSAPTARALGRKREADDDLEAP